MAGINGISGGANMGGANGMNGGSNASNIQGGPQHGDNQQIKSLQNQIKQLEDKKSKGGLSNEEEDLLQKLIKMLQELMGKQGAQGAQGAEGAEGGQGGQGGGQSAGQGPIPQPDYQGAGPIGG